MTKGGLCFACTLVAQQRTLELLCETTFTLDFNSASIN